MHAPSRHLQAMRASAPLVQNITNYVAMNVMANVMLAAGASPAMAHARGEAAEFAGLASALSINIGTLDREWIDCMVLAAKAASEKGTPWVQDPVAVGATALRQEAVGNTGNIVLWRDRTTVPVLINAITADWTRTDLIILKPEQMRAHAQDTLQPLFDHDGISYMGISPQSPIYQAMKGLEKGDSFMFHGKEVVVDEVF